jgi:hypothetical protein
VSARIAAVLVGLALLAVGCDSGDGSSRPSPGKTDDKGDDAEPVWSDAPEIIEACRGLYEGPPEGEEPFVDRCVAAVSGLPDPALDELS